MRLRPPDYVFAWLGPILLINIFIWVIAGVPQANSVLCANSENCLTDWVGALSGWAAVAAAFVTVSAMMRQQEDANRAQRDNVELEIMSRLALAERVHKKSDRALTSAVFMKRLLVGDLNHDMLKRMGGSLDRLKSDADSLIGSALWDDYIERIGTERFDSNMAHHLFYQVAFSSVQNYNDVTALAAEIDSYPEHILDEMKRDLLENCGHYADFLEKISLRVHGDTSAFIQKWRAKIS